MACHMYETNATQRANTPVRIAAVIFFQRGFLVGTVAMVEVLLINVQPRLTKSLEFRNVVGSLKVFNNAKRLGVQIRLYKRTTQCSCSASRNL